MRLLIGSRACFVLRSTQSQRCVDVRVQRVKSKFLSPGPPSQFFVDTSTAAASKRVPPLVGVLITRTLGHCAKIRKWSVVKPVRRNIRIGCDLQREGHVMFSLHSEILGVYSVLVCSLPTFRRPRLPQRIHTPSHALARSHCVNWHLPSVSSQDPESR